MTVPGSVITKDRIAQHHLPDEKPNTFGEKYNRWRYRWDHESPFLAWR